jgi:hypothetical protein
MFVMKWGLKFRIRFELNCFLIEFCIQADAMPTQQSYQLMHAAHSWGIDIDTHLYLLSSSSLGYNVIHFVFILFLPRQNKVSSDHHAACICPAPISAFEPLDRFSPVWYERHDIEGRHKAVIINSCSQY